MKRMLLSGVACSLSLVCSIAPSISSAAEKRKPVIGVSVLTLTNPFFRELSDGLKDEAKKKGMDVILTSGEFDVAKQKDQVANFIVKHVDAIVLCPCNSKSIGTSIASANKAGIPVFTADIASLSKDGKVVCHVATDNLGGGRLAAKAMIEALGGSGKVAILDFPEVESVILRTKGFEEVIAEHNKKGEGKIDIVAKLPGGGTKDKSFKPAEDVLQSHPDLNGIFAINDPSALGAVAALEKAGKAGQVKIIGFDGQPEGKQAIKDGKIYADPIQFPDKIGRQTAQAISKYLEGEDVPAQVLIPTELYKKADADKDPTLKK